MVVTKQKLAKSRNWFKYVLLGLPKPVEQIYLKPEESYKWKQILKLREELIIDFNKNSLDLGLKTTFEVLFDRNIKGKIKMVKVGDFYSGWFVKSKRSTLKIDSNYQNLISKLRRERDFHILN